MGVTFGLSLEQLFTIGYILGYLIVVRLGVDCYV